MADDFMEAGNTVEDTSASAAPSSQDQSTAQNEFDTAFDAPETTVPSEFKTPDEQAETEKPVEAAKPVERKAEPLKKVPAKVDTAKPVDPKPEEVVVGERPSGDVDPNQKFMADLKQLKPNADKITATAEFHAWAAQQKHLARAMNSTDPQVAADILDMYEQSLSEAPAKTEAPTVKPEVAPQPAAVPGGDLATALKAVTFKAPNGDTRNLGDLQEEYGELYSGMLAMQQAIVARAMEGFKAPEATNKTSAPEVIESLKAKISQFEQQFDAMRFKAAVMDEHPDFTQVTKSPEFKAWETEQSGKIQFMFKNGDAADVSKVLGWYKEDAAKAALVATKDRNTAKKGMIDKVSGPALRSNNSRTPQSASVPTGSDKDEFTRHFDSEEA